MKYAAEKQRDLNIWSNNQEEKLIQGYVDRETTVARERVEATETAIKQDQEDMKNAERRD